MHINGSCHCGELTYQADLDPQRVGICHCTDCQTLSGSAYRTIAVVPAAAFEITKGTVQTYVKRAESGNKRILASCPTCGANIYASEFSDTPAVYNLRVGTIAQRNDLPPRFECWTASALPWIAPTEGATQFKGNPQF